MNTTIKLPHRLFDAAMSEPASDQHAPLTALYIDAEHRAVIACNGHILACHPIPGDAGIKPGLITPEIWKAAKAKDMLLDYSSGTLNGHAIAAADSLGYAYPSWQPIIATHDTAYRIVVNPKLLSKVASALGNDDFLIMEFDATGKKAIRVLSGDATGILLPAVGGVATGLQAPVPERSDKAITPAPPVKPLDAAGKAAPAPPKPGRKDKPKREVPIATLPPVISRNEDKDGIELRFNGKPSDDILAMFRQRKWRWGPAFDGQPWYAKYTEEQWLFANSLATGSAYTPMPESPGTATPDAPEAPAIIASIEPKAPSRVRRIEIPEF